MTGLRCQVLGGSRLRRGGPHGADALAFDFECAIELRDANLPSDGGGQFDDLVVGEVLPDGLK